MIAGQGTRRPPQHKMMLSSRAPRRLSKPWTGDDGCPYMDFLTPAFGGKPFFPPALTFFHFALLLAAEFWSRLRDRPQGIKSDRRSQGIHVLRFCQAPRTN